MVSQQFVTNVADESLKFVYLWPGGAKQEGMPGSLNNLRPTNGKVGNLHIYGLGALNKKACQALGQGRAWVLNKKYQSLLYCELNRGDCVY